MSFCNYRLVLDSPSSFFLCTARFSAVAVLVLPLNCSLFCSRPPTAFSTGTVSAVLHWSNRLSPAVYYTLLLLQYPCSNSVSPAISPPLSVLCSSSSRFDPSIAHSAKNSSFRSFPRLYFSPQNSCLLVTMTNEVLKQTGFHQQTIIYSTPYFNPTTQTINITGTVPPKMQRDSNPDYSYTQLRLLSYHQSPAHIHYDPAPHSLRLHNLFCCQIHISFLHTPNLVLLSRRLLPTTFHHWNPIHTAASPPVLQNATLRPKNFRHIFLPHV